MEKVCSWNLVMQQVISRLQQDFEVTPQLWPECSLLRNFFILKYLGQSICKFVCFYVC